MRQDALVMRSPVCIIFCKWWYMVSILPIVPTENYYFCFVCSATYVFKLRTVIINLLLERCLPRYFNDLLSIMPRPVYPASPFHAVDFFKHVWALDDKLWLKKQFLPGAEFNATLNELENEESSITHYFGTWREIKSERAAPHVTGLSTNPLSNGWRRHNKRISSRKIGKLYKRNFWLILFETFYYTLLFNWIFTLILFLAKTANCCEL